MTETLIWISGATEGIGLGLARNCPYPGARIINMSRRQHPDYETVRLDLTDPASWDDAGASFAGELSAFQGKRALFIHNAYYSNEVGLIGKISSADHRKTVLANAAAPLVLGELFLAACAAHRTAPECEDGLMLMSSSAAVAWRLGMADYCAAKTGIEHWIEVVARERETQGGAGPWVLAVRPGAVNTDSVRRLTEIPADIYPTGERIRRTLANRMDIDTCARNIWAELPPKPGTSVLSFSEPPPDAELGFGTRTKVIAASSYDQLYR